MSEQILLKPLAGSRASCIILKQTSGLKLHYFKDKHPLTTQLGSYADKDKTLLHLFIDTKHAKNVQVLGNQLFGCSDADYASKHEETRKSTSGYCFFYCYNLVSWRSKLQPIIATSTHESELIALHTASQEAIWLRNFLAEFKSAVSGIL